MTKRVRQRVHALHTRHYVGFRLFSLNTKLFLLLRVRADDE